eukprot:Skav209403  [mRNA]  locus=scaffold2554:28110:45479:+ [translate_table: standard]
MHVPCVESRRREDVWSVGTWSESCTETPAVCASCAQRIDSACLEEFVLRMCQIDFKAMAVFKETFNVPDRTMNLASDGVWPECPACPCPDAVAMLGAILRWVPLPRADSERLEAILAGSAGKERVAVGKIGGPWVPYEEEDAEGLEAAFQRLRSAKELLSRTHKVTEGTDDVRFEAAGVTSSHLKRCFSRFSQLAVHFASPEALPPEDAQVERWLQSLGSLLPREAVSALVEEVRQQGMDGVAFDALVARRTPLRLTQVRPNHMATLRRCWNAKRPMNLSATLGSQGVRRNHKCSASGYKVGFIATMNSLRTDMIRPHLYVGNMADAAYWPLLKKLGITHVINCSLEAAERSRSIAQKVPPAYESKGIQYLLLPWQDREEEAQSMSRQRFRTLRGATQYIKSTLKAMGPTFASAILCNKPQGVSRSPALVCAYLMEYEGLSLDKALSEAQPTANDAKISPVKQ